MFANPVAVNGSCTHFVLQVSVTPIIVDPIVVADARCERALTTKVNTDSLSLCVPVSDFFAEDVKYKKFSSLFICHIWSDVILKLVD